MKLGENILKLRKENKLSQEELAEQVNVTRQTISNWELGETEPTPSQLKILSKIFNVSIDKLLDNDVDSLIINKVSNTEKLAGIIIKILKVIGILFLVILIIDIASLLIFSFVRKDVVSSITEEATINCSSGNNDYLITIGSDGYFNCSNCSKEIQNDISGFIDYSNINGTIEEIETYFSDNNGICE